MPHDHENFVECTVHVHCESKAIYQIICFGVMWEFYGFHIAAIITKKFSYTEKEIERCEDTFIHEFASRNGFWLFPFEIVI